MRYVDMNQRGKTYIFIHIYTYLVDLQGLPNRVPIEKLFSN